MKHPGMEDLALFAGGELNAIRRWRLARHIDGCPACRREAEAFGDARRCLQESAGELPAGLDWKALEAEMKANIRLGLAAGEIVATPHGVPFRLSWRPAAGLALATAVVVMGWFLNIPRPGRTVEMAGSGVVLESTRAGLELKENGRTLTMLEPASATVTYSVSGGGSMRARYVDSDTGQVTIANVYAQ